MNDTEHFENLAMSILKDADAARFCGLVCGAAHLFDDLIDKDQYVSDDQLVQGFRALLVQIPANPFYRQHFDQLHPLLDAFILSWTTANAFEADGEEEALRVAYVIRSDYINLVLRCAQLLHGFKYAQAIAPSLRELWHVEGWDGYLEALKRQKQGA